MASVTLTTLLSRARTRADMPSTNFVTDAELTGFLNEGNAKLLEKLVEAYGEQYFITTTALTTVAGTTSYALPADFFKLYGVELTVGGKVRTLKPFMFNERNFYKNQTSTWWNIPRYSIQGLNLILYPAPGAGSGSIYYAPAAALLSIGADTVNYPNGWEKYLVVYAAIRALNKEESPSNDLRDEMEIMEKELKELKESRDNSFPKTVVDNEAVTYYDDMFVW